MSEVKQRCQLESCNRAASTRCFCCNKNVCTRHFNEHIDAVKAQIDPLANEINTMVEKIQGLTIEKITETSFAELQQWSIDMHKLIDEIFSAKTKEIEDLIEKNKSKFDEHKKQQTENIMKIQDDIKQLVEDGDATFEQIQLLKNQLTNVETNLVSFRKDFLSINCRVLAQGLVTVSSNLTTPSTFRKKKDNQTSSQNLQSNSVNASISSTTSPSISAQNDFATQNPNLADFGSAATTSEPPTTGFSFRGFVSAFPNSPQTNSSSTAFGSGFSSTNVTNPFGGQSQTGSGSKPTIFGSGFSPFGTASPFSGASQ